MPLHEPPMRSHRFLDVAALSARRGLHLLLGVALVLTPPAAGAQRGGTIAMQGLADVELWATDSASPLLTRNAGRPSALGRLRLWSVAEPWGGVVLFAQGQLEGGTARAEEERMEVYLERAGLRIAPSRVFMLEGGKIPHPIGTFASRQLSSRNPLIGTPDGYPVQYPLGVSVSGATDRVDYRAALVSLPISHESYMPDPSSRYRPAVGGGVTPTAGVHVGVSATWGPYLNETLSTALLRGRRWDSFRQRLVAVDAEVSRGYLETHAELARSSYDIPQRDGTLAGLTYYLEGKYTIAPRVYVAARYERNEYPYVQPVSDSSWVARTTNLYNGEAGVGYRLSAARLLKVTYRTDQWRVDPTTRLFLRDGRALAMQVSQAFDVGDMLDRR